MKTEIKNCEDYRSLLCRVYEGLRNKEITEKEAKEMTREADRIARQATKEFNEMKRSGVVIRKILFFDVNYNEYKE